MALSFTPDGYLVAAASYNKILIWRAEEGGLPKACWVGEKGRWRGGGAVTRTEKSEPGGDGRSDEGEEDVGQDHSLSWDADGAKVAFALGSQVSCLRSDSWFRCRSDHRAYFLTGWTDSQVHLDRYHQFSQITDTQTFVTPFLRPPQLYVQRNPNNKIRNFQIALIYHTFTFFLLTKHYVPSPILSLGHGQDWVGVYGSISVLMT